MYKSVFSFLSKGTDQDPSADRVRLYSSWVPEYVASVHTAFGLVMKRKNRGIAEHCNRGGISTEQENLLYKSQDLKIIKEVKTLSQKSSDKALDP